MYSGQAGVEGAGFYLPVFDEEVVGELGLSGIGGETFGVEQVALYGVGSSFLLNGFLKSAASTFLLIR